MLNLRYYEKYYFSKSKPLPYKLKCGEEIKIYPVTVEDAELFDDCYDVLLIDKNSISDVGIIQMNYITFLKEVEFSRETKLKGHSLTYGENQYLKFFKLMEMCLHCKNAVIDKANGKNVVKVSNNDDDICDYYISSKEFDEISKIILYQNIKDYDDKQLDPTVQKLYNDYIKLKMKNGRTPTIEERKEYIMSHNGWTEDYINTITYRRLVGMSDMLLDEALYYGNKFIESSAKYDAKVSNHFLIEKKRSRYDGFVVSGDTIKQKIT